MFRERFSNIMNFEENYLIGFIIITHNCLITAKLRVGDWDSMSNFDILGAWLPVTALIIDKKEVWLAFQGNNEGRCGRL